MKSTPNLCLNKHEKLLRKSILAKTSKHKQPQRTPEELDKIRLSRVLKSERDERVDISQSLTAPKHYLGGFTVPKALRLYNHQPGGSYEWKSPYEKPRMEAYSKHEVVLFRTRWNLDKGVGIPQSPDHYITYHPLSMSSHHIIDLHRYSVGVTADTAKDKKFWKLWQNTRPDKTPKVVEDYALANPEEDFYVGFRSLPIDEQNSVSGSLYKEEDVSDKTGRSNGVDLSDPTSSLPEFPYFASTALIPQESTRPPAPLIYPLLRVILPTRPLARVFARLSRSLPTGLPYVAVIPLADRKDGKSAFRRLTRIRLNRMRRLIKDVADRFEGKYGGFPGIRLSHEDRGKGYRGERLGEPFPEEFKQIRVLLRPNLLTEREIEESWRILPNVSIGYMDDLGREISEDLSKIIEKPQHDLSITSEDYLLNQENQDNEDDE